MNDPITPATLVVEHTGNAQRLTPETTTSRTYGTVTQNELSNHIKCTDGYFKELQIEEKSEQGSGKVTYLLSEAVKKGVIRFYSDNSKEPILQLGPRAALGLNILSHMWYERGGKAENKRTIHFSVADFARLRGRDIKECRKLLHDILEEFYYLSIEYERKGKSSKRKHAAPLDNDIQKFRIIAEYTEKRYMGVRVTFGDTFLQLLSHYAPMPYPRILFSFDPKKQGTALNVAEKIFQFVSINLRTRNLAYRPDLECNISVATLLDAAHKKAYANASQKERSYYYQTVRQIENALNSLKNAFTWTYLDTNGKKIESIRNHDYSSYMVRLKFKDYPPPKYENKPVLDVPFSDISSLEVEAS